MNCIIFINLKANILYSRLSWMPEPLQFLCVKAGGRLLRRGQSQLGWQSSLAEVAPALLWQLPRPEPAQF